MIKAGVIGWPIEHSKSPILHGHWLDVHGIDGSYEKIALAPDAFEDGIRKLIKDGFAGANVTVPFKERAFAMADEVSPNAQVVGAANTLVFKGGKILADSTDAHGFIANVMHSAPDWNAGAGPALVLGAGGAARSVVASLLDAGVPEVILANRTRARAETLAALFGGKVVVADWATVDAIVEHVAMIVNTTLLGMSGQAPLEIDLSSVSPDCLVTDIVYNPLRTPLLQVAQARGCPTVDGLGMLLHQAVPGFEAWFGVRPVVDEMLRQKVLASL